MAGLIFSSSFEKTSNPRRALAFNLLGAVGGALLEYLSNYIGVNNLVLIAAMLYVCSWLCFTKVKSGLAPTQQAPDTAN
jgi:hypothetical protein